MRFLDAVEQQHLAKDARFAALEDRVRNWSALLDALAPAFSERSREEWMRRLVAADIPAAEVLCISDVLEEPAVRPPEMFAVVDHPVAGLVHLSPRPAMFDVSRGRPDRKSVRAGKRGAVRQKLD